jgi:hypothetical protein
VQVATTISDTNSYSNSTAVFTVGVDYAHTNPFVGSLCLLRSSATAPSADQIAYIYETERKMFEAGAQVTIAGSSSAVTCLDYDEMTDLYHVGTTYGRSTFKGLVRVGSEATTNGTPVGYASYDSTLIQAGSTGAKIAVPAKPIRGELNRYRENIHLIQLPENNVFTGDDNTTIFSIPAGWKPKWVYIHGILMREGLTYDYTITYDGFVYSVVFITPPRLTSNISILATRV